MPSPPALVLVGDNQTKIWGMSIDERTRRIAAAQKLPFGRAASPALLVNRGFVVDPSWIAHHAGTPGAALITGGVPVLVHARNEAERDAATSAMQSGTALPATLTVSAFEDGVTISNEALRKREQPFALPLRPDTVRGIERASYFGAYKGVTDLLTKYLWPEWALVLTRLAARIGMSPNQVTAVGALLCVAATVCFWHGWYWTGLATGLGFMVLDTVDGKLARCTITSSKWGNVFDHGIDLVHPPFWWWAWAVGLGTYGRPFDQATFASVLGVILGGYVLQRVVEGAFMRLYGMHVHVWRRFDSRFRLITARRNPNMVILFVALLLGRPDLGLIWVAWWTALSLLVHVGQLVQAMLARGRGEPIRSWLA